MTFDPELADDALLVDGTETVTYRVQAAGAGSPISGALRRELSRSELAMGALAGIEATELAWNLPGTSLGAIEPTQGDTITDSQGAVWIVVAARRTNMTGVWRVMCRKAI